MTTHVDVLKYEIEKLEAERDAARAALALAVDSEHDAVKRAQELEAELHEVREHLVKTRAVVIAERDELRRLLRAALKQNTGWYSDEAAEAERLLEGDDAP